jgi:2'-5' RNA ligase
MSVTHNIAITFGQSFAQHCIDLAGKHFTLDSQNYCLNPRNSIPHITLTQLSLDNDAHIHQIEGLLASVTVSKPTLHITGLTTRYSERNDTTYIELVINKPPSLLDIHQKICSSLISQNIKIVSKNSQNYHPHLTLADTNNGDLDTEPLKSNTKLLNDGIQETPLSISFGTSDPFGQLQRIIYTRLLS